MFPARAPIRHRPSQQQIQADLRQIGVAIGVRELAHANNADHRNEHSQIPTPARQKPGALSPACINRSRYDSQQEERQGDFPKGSDLLRKGVKSGQSGGPHHLAQINDVGNTDIAQPRRHGNLGVAYDPLLHHKISHDARPRSQRQQGNLFQDQTTGNPPIPRRLNG